MTDPPRYYLSQEEFIRFCSSLSEYFFADCTGLFRWTSGILVFRGKLISAGKTGPVSLRIQPENGEIFEVWCLQESKSYYSRYNPFFSKFPDQFPQMVKESLSTGFEEIMKSKSLVTESESLE